MDAGRLICGILAVVLLTGGGKRQDRDLTTDLHRAAAYGDLQQVQTLLARSARVGARDDRGRTPLHLAAENGHQEVAQILVRCGTFVDALAGNGRTPAELAMGADHVSVVELLRASGAKVNAEDDHGGRPLHDLLGSYRYDGSVWELIDYLGIDIKEKNEDPCEPARAAARREEGNRRMQILDLLLARGADVNGMDGYGWTPLHVAAREEGR